MHSASTIGLPFLALLLVGGCSSETTTPADAGVEASTHDASANCVKPGTANNELGLGAYCEKKADCPATGALCTANFNAPDNAWFCSKLCSAEDTKCGAGMYCSLGDPRGNACVPLVCGPADAGAEAAPVDGSSDASSDAPGDAPAE
jgi:hypothetical protein